MNTHKIFARNITEAKYDFRKDYPGEYIVSIRLDREHLKDFRTIHDYSHFGKRPYLIHSKKNGEKWMKKEVVQMRKAWPAKRARVRLGTKVSLDPMAFAKKRQEVKAALKQETKKKKSTKKLRKRKNSKKKK